MGKHALSFIFLLATVLEIASGLYFHLGENERKCFIEEIPDETTIIVNYRMEFFDSMKQVFTNNNPGIGMQVMIKDPDDKVVLSATYGTEHKIVMVSSTHGEHIICMNTNSSAWFGGQQVRVHIDIQVGEHAIDYNQVAKKEKLSELQLRIRQLLDQVDQITKEQGYQRYREAIFRNTSESTNSRVLWWSITQTIVLLVMGAWQMRHLKSFFEAKKLV